MPTAEATGRADAVAAMTEPPEVRDAAKYLLHCLAQGAEPVTIRLNPSPEPTEAQIAEWQERLEEAMQDPKFHRLRPLGVSDEELDRTEWEREVRHKLDSALFALENGWSYTWDRPYEYAALERSGPEEEDDGD